MGVYNFFIELKTDEKNLNTLKQVYQNNGVYQKAFHFNQFLDDTYGEYNAGISSVIDNFLPANHLIYRFLSSCDYKTIYIRTNKNERYFDFDTKAEFINFMYMIWEKNIDNLYCQCGTFLVDVKKYNCIRNKLYLKHYSVF